MSDHRPKFEEGHSRITGHRAAITVEGNPADPGGRRLRGNTHSGGRIESRIDPDGRFVSELRGSFEGGRESEWLAFEVLLEVLRRSGGPVEEVGRPRDDYGEDRLVRIDEERLTVQMVSVPADPEVWRQLSQNPIILEGELDDLIGHVRGAVERKRHVPPGVILVLEASLLGAAVSQKLVDAYIQRYGSPEEELEAVQVWLVGRTKLSALRMV